MRKALATIGVIVTIMTATVPVTHAPSVTSVTYAECMHMGGRHIGTTCVGVDY